MKNYAVKTPAGLIVIATTRSRVTDKLAAQATAAAKNAGLFDQYAAESFATALGIECTRIAKSDILRCHDVDGGRQLDYSGFSTLTAAPVALSINL